MGSMHFSERVQAGMGIRSSSPNISENAQNRSIFAHEMFRNPDFGGYDGQLGELAGYGIQSGPAPVRRQSPGWVAKWTQNSPLFDVPAVAAGA